MKLLPSPADVPPCFRGRSSSPPHPPLDAPTGTLYDSLPKEVPVHRLLTVVFVFVFACLGPIFPQTTSTSILGTVADPTGAVVVGAKVMVQQVGTGLKREELTSSSGDYTFSLLEVGEYEVTAEAAGFKTETRKNIILEVNQKARVDFT